MLICSWPMPAEVLSAYDAFAARLKSEMPSAAYIYPASTLHCTVLTLRAFTGGPLDEAARKQLIETVLSPTDLALGTCADARRQKKG